MSIASSHSAERRAMEKALQQAAARRQVEQLGASRVRPLVAGFKTIKRGKVTLPALQFLGGTAVTASVASALVTISELVHRLTAARGEDIPLSCAVLEWLREEPGFHVPGETGWRQPAHQENARWLKHNRILVGDLGASYRLMRDLFPGSVYHLGGGAIVQAQVYPFGEDGPSFDAWSRDDGAALLAATLLAYEAVYITLTAAAVEPLRGAA
ncbi:hypothetical protein [Antarcticirhabdus aurantiaca]|uniref:Uncharacterized protein n=1 Tax=Antarcticirhabdus aurantiaca TaxID=2606717 RepID=A0ACD4NRA7_9HYPH|nr:hypothetical protein OXU80_03495 [Jeongeuplla avenae]